MRPILSHALHHMRPCDSMALSVEVRAKRKHILSMKCLSKDNFVSSKGGRVKLLWIRVTFHAGVLILQGR